MEQPREPKFYPNEQQSIFRYGKKNDVLQSIDSTLKRIEVILLDFQKMEHPVPLKALQDAVEVSLSQHQGIAPILHLDSPSQLEQLGF